MTKELLSISGRIQQRRNNMFNFVAYYNDEEHTDGEFYVFRKDCVAAFQRYCQKLAIGSKDIIDEQDIVYNCVSKTAHPIYNGTEGDSTADPELEALLAEEAEIAKGNKVDEVTELQREVKAWRSRYESAVVRQLHAQEDRNAMRNLMQYWEAKCVELEKELADTKNEVIFREENANSY